MKLFQNKKNNASAMLISLVIVAVIGLMISVFGKKSLQVLEVSKQRLMGQSRELKAEALLESLRGVTEAYMRERMDSIGGSWSNPGALFDATQFNAYLNTHITLPEGLSYQANCSGQGYSIMWTMGYSNTDSPSGGSTGGQTSAGTGAQTWSFYQCKQDDILPKRFNFTVRSIDDEGSYYLYGQALFDSQSLLDYSFFFTDQVDGDATIIGPAFHSRLGILFQNPQDANNRIMLQTPVSTNLQIARLVTNLPQNQIQYPQGYSVGSASVGTLENASVVPPFQELISDWRDSPPATSYQNLNSNSNIEIQFGETCDDFKIFADGVEQANTNREVLILKSDNFVIRNDPASSNNYGISCRSRSFVLLDGDIHLKASLESRARDGTNTGQKTSLAFFSNQSSFKINSDFLVYNDSANGGFSGQTGTSLASLTSNGSGLSVGSGDSKKTTAVFSGVSFISPSRQVGDTLESRPPIELDPTLLLPTAVDLGKMRTKGLMFGGTTPQTRALLIDNNGNPTGNQVGFELETEFDENLRDDPPFGLTSATVGSQFALIFTQIRAGSQSLIQTIADFQ